MNSHLAPIPFAPLAALMLLAVAALLAPQAADARARADLRVTKLYTSAYAHPGGELPLNATVARTARAVPRTKLRFYLSADRKRSKGDVRLARPLRVRALRGKTRSAAVAANVKVPAGTKAGRLRVLACADDPGRLKERSERNNCRASQPLTVTATADPARTSAALIEAARRAGKLSNAQALAYRVFAVFGDPRLPNRFAGDATAEADHSVFRAVGDAWPTLPAKLRKQLAPLLAPPAQARSAPKRKKKARRSQDLEGDCVIDSYKDIDWRSMRAPGGKVIVHWDPERPGDAGPARRIAAYAAEAWTHHKRVMGREPLSDAKVPCFHGPDGALDIYIRPNIPRANAVTMPSAMRTVGTPACDGMPSFILTEPTGSQSLSLKFTVAHELFHAFQNAYVESAGCADYSWFDEGTANWAAHGVYPDDQSEHLFDSQLRFPDSEVTSSDYDSWVFALWMQKRFGEGSIRTAYQQFAKLASIPGVDKAIGTWRKNYLDFARHGWNQKPYTSFLDWDKLATIPQGLNRPIAESRLFLAGQKQRTAYQRVGIAPHARNYHPYALTDPKIREITYKNPFPNDPDHRVGAILFLRDGTTRFDEWSGRRTVRYCRDNPAQDIEKFVVVSANSRPNKPFSGGWLEGTGELALKDACETFPWRFEVLDASIETDTTASRAVNDDHICGSIAGLPISGRREFSASRTTRYIDADNVVKKDFDNSLSGGVYAKGPGGWHDTLHGCENLFDTPQVCDTTLDRQLQGEGQTIGFSVDAASADAATATLNWAIPNPSVGFFDADESVCYVFEIWKGLDLTDEQQVVPMSKLKSGSPVTITFEGDGQWTTDQLGKPAQIAASWKTSLTIRRVDSDGNPL